jgi:hypothetical protein
MNNQKADILKRIDALIDKRKEELIRSFTSIHELNDGIILRSFSEWDNCGDNENIKYKIIPNKNDVDEIIVFHYIPKNTVFEHKKRDYIKSITTLSGKLELIINGEPLVIDNYCKIVLEDNTFSGVALEDTYTVTSSKQ